MKHPSSNLNAAATIAAIIALSGSLIVPDIMESLAPFLLFFSVVLIGIPHGAIDHIVASKVYGLKKRLIDFLLFYASYLIVMLIIGALWLFFPSAGMIFFLLISIYHFGQADMVSLMHADGWIPSLFAWLRGLLIIGIIIFGHPEISLPIIETAIRTDSALTLFYDYSGSLLTLTIIPYVIILLVSSIKSELNHTKSTFFLESLLLITLLMITHPLVGFAIYFALWHSAGHVLEMASYFKKQGDELSITRFYRLATPFTLVSLVGLAILFYVQRALAFGDEMVSLLFILISVLTLPHMIVVDKMYKSEK